MGCIFLESPRKLLRSLLRVHSNVSECKYLHFVTNLQAEKLHIKVSIKNWSGKMLRSIFKKHLFRCIIKRLYGVIHSILQVE